MENISHRYVDIRGLKLHVSEIGTGLTLVPSLINFINTCLYMDLDPLQWLKHSRRCCGAKRHRSGPAVVFLHGFPEIWYSWRHQMIGVAKAGFRAIAPDFRGYGLSERPIQPEKTTFKDLVDDLLVMLDILSISKAIVVGKDFGARFAYHFALLHRERVVAVVTLGVPFVIVSPETFPGNLPKGFYVLRFREPGRAEQDFARFDVKTVIKKIYIMFTASELQVASEDEEIMDLVDESAPLPAWFTQEDLQTYADSYDNSGFQTPLQVPYRAWLEDYGVDDLIVRVPSLLIMGDKDYALKFGGFEHYITSGMAKNNVPDLETIFVRDGTHFVQEQFPHQVNDILIEFLTKHA